MKEYYTVKEFAAKFALAEITVRQWIGTGKIKSVKIGKARRIPAEEVERLEQKSRGD